MPQVFNRTGLHLGYRKKHSKIICNNEQIDNLALKTLFYMATTKVVITNTKKTVIAIRHMWVMSGSEC